MSFNICFFVILFPIHLCMANEGAMSCHSWSRPPPRVSRLPGRAPRSQYELLAHQDVEEQFPGHGGRPDVRVEVPYTFAKVPVWESPRATASRVQEVCQDNPDTMKAHSSQNEPPRSEESVRESGVTPVVLHINIYSLLICLYYNSFISISSWFLYINVRRQ